jgi:hypothetical protein
MAASPSKIHTRCAHGFVCLTGTRREHAPPLYVKYPRYYVRRIVQTGTCGERAFLFQMHPVCMRGGSQGGACAAGRSAVLHRRGGARAGHPAHGLDRAVRRPMPPTMPYPPGTRASLLQCTEPDLLHCTGPNLCSNVSYANSCRRRPCLRL